MQPRPSKRFAAALLVACMLLFTLQGCSKPIDPTSNVPALYQPLVLILALVGAGIGITALHHHNEEHSSGGGGKPALTPPSFVGAVGNQPFDLSLDPSVPGSIGVLGRNGGGGRYGFTEIGSSSTNAGSYQLPSGYQPVAVAVDGAGNDWFVDSSGNVDRCAPPSSTVTACTPAVAVNDGLGTGGVRSIAADASHVFLALDRGAGTVTWTAFALDGTGPVKGSYTYTGSGMYNTDAVVALSGQVISTYVIFHKDGTSWTLPLPGPATKNSFTFSPAPLPTENVAYDGTTLYYGFLGSATSGSYLIGRWAAANNTLGQTPGSLVSQIRIAYNGQTSPNGAPFSVPVFSAHTDGTSLYMLDSSGNLVLFTAF